MKRRRSQQIEEEPVELGEVLETNEQQWQDEFVYDQPYDLYDESFDDYSSEHEAADHESRFRLAIGLFDIISIFVGVSVILALVAMLTTLLQWLRNDILHSAILLTSGLL